PHLAPEETHALIAARSLSGSGFLGGISPFSIRSHSKLSFNLPATSTFPLSPPASAVFAWLRSSPPFFSALLLWQSRHLLARIGAIVRSKSGSAASARNAIQKKEHPSAAEINRMINVTSFSSSWFRRRS